jgi:dTMP kinase
MVRNFIVIEGADGAGTSTQVSLLAQRLSARRLSPAQRGQTARPSARQNRLAAQYEAAEPGPPEYDASPFCIATAEPTSGAVGGIVRRLLKARPSGEAAHPLRPETLARLFAADRADHLWGRGGIIALCAAGHAVVSDRYAPSSLVYQAIECGEELPRALNALFPLPELLVYLDIDSETAEKRLQSRGSREIFEKLAFQKKVREGYLRLLPEWESRGVRVARIDGSLPVEQVAAAVWEAAAEMPIIVGN